SRLRPGGAVPPRGPPQGGHPDMEGDRGPPGLNEDTARQISAGKDEPAFMLQWRLNAYRHWTSMGEPRWPNVHYPPIDYQGISYYSAPRPKKQLDSLHQGDPDIPPTFPRLRLP